jgi:hypothetical protein
MKQLQKATSAGAIAAIVAHLLLNHHQLCRRSCVQIALDPESYYVKSSVPNCVTSRESLAPAIRIVRTL